MSGIRWAARPWFLLLVVTGILFLGRLGIREFWSPDEPRFALIAQETLQQENPLVPHFHGEVYSNKPPLYLWLVGLFSLPWGRVTEWSARLPSALAAIGSVQVTYLLGRRLLGERAGWIGAGVLLTAGHFFWRARWASTDMTLSFFVLLSMYFLVRALSPEGEGGLDAASGRWFFVACGLATLTKGPVGLVLPVGILLLTLAALRRMADLRRFPWLTGLAAYGLLVVPWYLFYGMAAGGDKFLIMALTENVSRYLNAWNDVKPFYFYLFRFPVSFLPWSLLLPAALFAALRRPPRDAEPALRFLGIWFLFVFLFFSISSGKRTVYLLPAFPAAALFLGWFLDRGHSFLGSRRFAATLLTSLAVAGTFLAAGAAITLQTPVQHPPAAGAGLAAGLILILAAGPLAFLGGRNRLPSMAATLGTAMLLLQGVFALWFFPRMNGYQNVREFSSRILEVVPAEARFASTGKKRDAFSFYTGLSNEWIRDGDDLERLFRSPEPVYCLLRESEWERGSREKNLSGTILLRETVSRHTYVLVANEVPDENPSP